MDGSNCPSALFQPVNQMIKKIPKNSWHGDQEESLGQPKMSKKSAIPMGFVRLDLYFKKPLCPKSNQFSSYGDIENTRFTL